MCNEVELNSSETWKDQYYRVEQTEQCETNCIICMSITYSKNITQSRRTKNPPVQNSCSTLIN